MPERIPPLPDATPCRGCGHPIRFVPSSASTKLMALEADPHPKGNVWVRDPGDGVAAQVLGPDAAKAYRRAGSPLFISHHARCPKAGEFRRA